MSVDQRHTSGQPVPLRRLTPAEPPQAEFIHLRLVDQARRAAGVLSALGTGSGERVAALLPMVPESVAVTMACGRLDALRVSLGVEDHVEPLRERIRESGARVVVTADAMRLGDRSYPAKAMIDRAVIGCPAVRTVLVVHRLGRPVPWRPGRDRWWHEALDTLEP
ncbi:AMP-binding protein [Streptomyces sp. 549]|uniref:AMP-binding protein n=1 Tax=Streptomyces sp. 549 TaxID=3049076 RepID=UPI0024C43BA5|nr:AMP-binding protein [Streptomyces sp. 549]MDK1476564.1 AMP-binding protein [Streptomyces sp. 549]